MLLSKSVDAPSAFPTVKPTQGLQELAKEPKESLHLTLGFHRPELAQLLNCEQFFPCFLNLGHISSSTHFLPAVSHVLRLEFNAKSTQSVLYLVEYNQVQHCP